VFKGVRYATAERFCEPVVECASHLRDALELAPMCPQHGLGFVDSVVPPPLKQTCAEDLYFADEANPVRVVPYSEDCLNLNIVAPLKRRAAALFPVMIYFHGGAFESGSNSDPTIDGRRLAGRGVVVVTANYRLGVLGFLAGVKGIVPNLGLHDQVAALRWVKKHIASFGGDPDNVTAFGESAGAAAVASLMGTRVRRDEGLFHKAVLMSGAASWTLSQANALALRDAIARALGCAAMDVNTLRAMDIRALVKAAGSVSSAGRTRDAAKLRVGMHGRTLPFSPVVLEDAGAADEPLFEGTHPLVAVARGMASDVAVMAGVTDSEWTFFMMDGAWKKRFALPAVDAVVERHAALLEGWATGDSRHRAVPDVKAQCARIVRFYVAQAGGGAAASPEHVAEHVYERLHSVWMIELPAYRLLEAHARALGRGRAWRLTLHSAVESLRSPHGMDIPLVFGNLDSLVGKVLCGDVAEAAAAVSRDMMATLTAFASTGALPKAGEVRAFGPGRPLPSLFATPGEAPLWNDFLRNVELEPEYFARL